MTLLVRLRFFRLKKKIKKDPFIGILQQDNSYSYEEEGHIVNYRIQESLPGVRTIEWLSLKRRFGFFERKLFHIKRSLNKFFLYQRWLSLFRPQVAVILIVTLMISYFVVTHSLKRIEHFKWIASRITGVSPEAIRYEGGGWFNVIGQRGPLDRNIEPVRIRFNPLGWLFFQDTANITRWNPEVNSYIDYSFTINDKGDVWLERENVPAQGSVLGNNIKWDEPQGVRRVPAQDIVTKGGKLEIIDK